VAHISGGKVPRMNAEQMGVALPNGEMGKTNTFVTIAM